MARAFKCDECGKLFEELKPFFDEPSQLRQNYHAEIEVIHARDSQGTGIRDQVDSQLCPACQVKLLEVVLENFKFDLANQEVKSGQSI